MWKQLKVISYNWDQPLTVGWTFWGEAHENQAGHQPASRCIGGPGQKSGVVMENERQTEEIKRQVANNSGGYTRVLGVSQGSSLPHSLHESLFQSVHTRSPFFHRQLPHTPIHSQFAAKGSFWNTSPSKLQKFPCQVSSSSSSVFRPLFSSSPAISLLLSSCHI